MSIYLLVENDQIRTAIAQSKTTDFLKRYPL